MRNTNNTNRRGNNARRDDSRRAAYMYDNTARELEPVRTSAPARRRKVEREAEVVEQPKKIHRMNLGSLLIMAIASAAALFMLSNYVQLRTELTTVTRAVASKEKSLNDLKLDNDETLNRIESSIDLEQIKAVAIGEMGMRYATEGQIVYYTNESNDYMRQVAQD